MTNEELAKVNAEIANLNAETAKLLRETRWPPVVLAALVIAGMGIVPDLIAALK